jgi:hypothetical protein
VGRRNGRVVPAGKTNSVPPSGQMERSGAQEGREEGQANLWNEEVRTAWRDIIDTVIVPALVARFVAERENADEDAAA